MYKWLLVALMMTFSLFACATDKQTKRWTLTNTLKVMERVATEKELLAEIGSPHGTTTFNPGAADDPDPANRLSSRESWRKSSISTPPDIVDVLPIGTEILSYAFGYGTALVGGAFLVYIDDSGKILGYSYTKTLVGLETRARMSSRP